MTAIDTHAQPHGHASPGTAGGDGHHASPEHAKYPFLAHHFESPAQQFDSGKLGMWIFLATEVLFFGALFALYAILRFREPDVFRYASHYLDTIMGGINTCVLILSSVTMALAVHFAQRSMKKALVACLVLTFLGACGFLVIKYFEYTHKFHENLVWGTGFYQPVAGEEAAAELHKDGLTTLTAVPVPAATGAVTAQSGRFKTPAVETSVIAKAAVGPTGISTAPVETYVEKVEAGVEHGGVSQVPHLYDPKMPVNTHQFFAIYYAMTGLHGIHVIIGMFVIGGLVIAALRGKYDSNYFTPVDLVGLYWHIVDLIWIFLFPLFYLIH